MKKTSAFIGFLVVASALFIANANTNATRAQNVARPTELTISAAASLKEVLTALQAQYKTQRPNVKLSFNFGASGALQKQIERGAPVDVFIAASDKNINALAAQKLIDVASRRVVASNRLVLVVPINSTTSTRSPIRSFRDLARADVRNVAIGAPQSVPAGAYAQQVFTNIGVWPRVLLKAVQCKDVRAVLTQVELGNVDAGIVYRSDAALSRRVRVVTTAPANLHQPIHYPAAIVSATKNQIEARRLIAFWASTNARPTWKRFQFLVP